MKNQTPAHDLHTLEGYRHLAWDVKNHTLTHDLHEDRCRRFRVKVCTSGLGTSADCRRSASRGGENAARLSGFCGRLGYRLISKAW